MLLCFVIFLYKYDLCILFDSSFLRMSWDWKNSIFFLNIQDEIKYLKNPNVCFFIHYDESRYQWKKTILSKKSNHLNNPPNSRSQTCAISCNAFRSCLNFPALSKLKMAALYEISCSQWKLHRWWVGVNAGLSTWTGLYRDRNYIYFFNNNDFSAASVFVNGLFSDQGGVVMPTC